LENIYGLANNIGQNSSFNMPGPTSEQPRSTYKVAGITIPAYKDLPPVPGMPHGCTWGLWDSNGQRDQLGTLNLLTSEVVLQARKEIQLGISVAVNWSLDKCSTPHSQRKKPEHRILLLPEWVGHDDEININTQSGSQWDGFRESYPATG
jgi:hypothetical protein